MLLNFWAQICQGCIYPTDCKYNPTSDTVQKISIGVLIWHYLNFEVSSIQHPALTCKSSSIFYLAQTFQRNEGIIQGALVSMASRQPSSMTQRKNLQTLGLVTSPTYWTPFLELFLLMIRSL